MSIQDEIPKSRLTLRYKTNIEGQVANIELPMRLLVLGDFSSENPKEEEFSKREIISFDGTNLDSVIRDMNITLDIKESGYPQPIPINDMNCFRPGSIVDAVPELKDIEDKKNLLNALLANINNSGNYRDAVNTVIEDSIGEEEFRTALSSAYGLKVADGNDLTGNENGDESSD